MKHQEDYAVIVAVSNYPFLRDLQGPVADAKAVLAWLVDQSGGSVPNENIRLVIGENLPTGDSERARPIVDDVDEAFDTLLSGISKADQIGRRLYIYLSGHGYATGPDEVALLMANASPQLPGRAINGKAYADNVRRSGLFDEVVLFVDCDRSEIHGLPHDPSWLPQRRGDPRRESAFFYAFAASLGTHAYETIQPEGEVRGTFTAALLAGLTGAAATPEGLVTSATLQDYLAHAGSVRGAVPQKPFIMTGGPKPIVFVDPSTVTFELDYERLRKSWKALECANGIRLLQRSDKIHMEHLIVGLFDQADERLKAVFRSAELDRSELLTLIQERTGSSIPSSYDPSTLTTLPLLSKHVHEALTKAAVLANERKIEDVDVFLLFYGALSIEHCKIIKALRDRGIRREEIEIEKVEKPTDRTIRPSVPLGAGPTPRVASDQWSEHDKLGYEAYARTIAGLVTHSETVPPLTIGIKAPWGAGKTTLMKRVQHLLDGDADFTEENKAGSIHIVQTSAITLGQLLISLNKRIITTDTSNSLMNATAQKNRRPLLKPLAYALTMGRRIFEFFGNVFANTLTVTKLRPKPSLKGKTYGLPARMTVWFNPWKYQTSEQIWAGMAHCIISQITARMDAKQRELFWLRLHGRRIKAEEVRWRIYEAIVRQIMPTLLLFAVGVIVIFGLSLIFIIPVFWRVLGSAITAIPAVWKFFRTLGDQAASTMRDLVREPDYEGKLGFLYLVESDLRDVLDLASINKQNPLIIFIDDLDRCMPNRVAQVIEAINQFLYGDYPSCIFVVGMEPGMVAAALEVANKDVIEKAQALGLADSVVPMGWRFMEKIVQLPITIPPPTATSLLGYVSWLTSGNQTKGPLTPEKTTRADDSRQAVPDETLIQHWIEQFQAPKDVEQVVQVTDSLFRQAPTEQRTAVAEASKRVYASTLSERDPIIDKFVNEVTWLLGSNPRQIKRYVNVFRFYSTLRHALLVDATASNNAIHLPSDSAMAKFVALSINWPHAIDCFRLTRDVKSVPKTQSSQSLLAVLESESKAMPADDLNADKLWTKFLKDNNLSLGPWICTRSFRRFLAQGETLSVMEGHGLW